MHPHRDRERLDIVLVQHSLADSRSQAQALIRSGRVKVDGRITDKPGTPVPPDAQLEVRVPPRYVSRGGEKLEAALRAFQVNPAGRVCLDVGASTGGFTDCLLQHGAARVYAVDVGKGLLDWKLRRDPRVVVREGVNARYLEPAHVPESIELAVVDVAFISLRLVLPAVRRALDTKGEVVALVKPQFEAGRSQVRRGGVVRDPRVHVQVLAELRDFAGESLGWALAGAAASPLLGPAGNMEFFLHLCPGTHDTHGVDLTALVAEAHDELLHAHDASTEDQGRAAARPPPPPR